MLREVFSSMRIYEFIIPNLSYLCSLFYLKNERLKPGFKYKITLWICVLMSWIHKGYFVVKKLCKMFIIKLSNIQIIFIFYWFWSLINKAVSLRSSIHIVHTYYDLMCCIKLHINCTLNKVDLGLLVRKS